MTKKKRWRNRLLLFLSVLVLVGAGVYFLYLAPKPRYCWLVFGPEAKTRVLLWLKGEALFIEREAEDNLKGPAKRLTSRWDIFKDVTLTDPDGETTYVISRISPSRERRIVSVDIKGPLDYQQYCDIGLSDDPQKAPLAHFHGPLKVQPARIGGQLPPHLALRRGDKGTDFEVYVGTVDATKGCWTVVESEQRGKPGTPFFPKGVHPIAEIEFPSQSPGALPIKRIYALDKTC